MLVQIRNGMTEKELVEKAADAGIKVYPLRDCFIEVNKDETPVIMLGYAKLNAATMESGLKILKNEWKL